MSTLVRIIHSTDFVQTEREVNALCADGYKVRTTGFSSDGTVVNLLLVKQNDEENVVDEDTHQGRYRRGVKRLRGGV